MVKIDGIAIMSTATYLKIGELAKQTGLAVGTLRYYSDLGLLLPSRIGDNGYRYYSKDASSQVQFIKKRRRPRVGVRRKGMRPKQSTGFGIYIRRD